jgi:hypothetical protein
MPLPGVSHNQMASSEASLSLRTCSRTYTLARSTRPLPLSEPSVLSISPSFAAAVAAWAKFLTSVEERIC